MQHYIDSKRSIASSTTICALFGAFLGSAPTISIADIIWSGDFSTGDFTQYHSSTDRNEVYFFLIPEYGRPIQYGKQQPGHVGNGDLLSLVARTERTVNGITYPKGPTRGSEYAAKITIKNSKNGSDILDADPSGDPNRRRTQFQLLKMLSDQYDALPHMAERWMSYSVYIPSDWEVKQGGWGPTLFGPKPRHDGGGVSGTLKLALDGNSWSIIHRWSDIVNPSGNDVPWQQQMVYTGNFEGTGKPYPNRDNWPDGMADFPNVQQSYAALQSVNIGGWTDWIFHFKADHRGSRQGGTGWATIWKREDSGPWIKVLHIRPKVVTRGGMTFDHGIGYNVPAGPDNNGGYGMNFGLGGAKEVYWNAARNSVIYVANIKIGDANTKFADMSPDGSSPGADSDLASKTPKPPELLSAE